MSVPRLADALLWKLRYAVKYSSKAAEEDQDPLTFVHRFETKLHRYVQHRLKKHFAADPDAWWRKGVPLKIRQECAQRREEDPEPDDPYAYTYLIHLKEIIEKNWTLFEDDLKIVLIDSHVVQKKQFLDLLTQVNNIRNRHSHPIRAPEPGSEEYTNDLQCARELDQVVDLLVASAR